MSAVKPTRGRGRGKGFGPSKKKRKEYWIKLHEDLNLGLEEKKERMSKTERRLKKALKDLFPGKKFVKIRPDFLLHEETGRNLEIDLYCEELKLGIEEQGGQHYNPCKAFHKSRQEWLDQVKRDAIKVEKCAKNGIHLFVLPDVILARNLRDFLRIHLAKYNPVGKTGNEKEEDEEDEREKKEWDEKNQKKEEVKKKKEAKDISKLL
jgi:hypothetical protein